MDRHIRHYAALSSTMDEARRMVEEGCASGAIVIADVQHAGRGRVAGRMWRAESGSSLLMTLILGQNSAWLPALPLRVGLGLCRALETIACAHGVDSAMFKIKWPNDIVVVDTFAPEQAPCAALCYKKIAGILCEGVQGRALAGIGLNMRQHSFPDEIASRAISIAQACSIDLLSLPSAESLAVSIADSVDAAIASRDWREEIITRLLCVRKTVRFSVGHPDSNNFLRGIIEGIDTRGQLLISTDDGCTHAFSSGELSLQIR